jgi:hypothetical protein
VGYADVGWATRSRTVYNFRQWKASSAATLQAATTAALRKACTARFSTGLPAAMPFFGHHRDPSHTTSTQNSASSGIDLADLFLKNPSLRLCAGTASYIITYGQNWKPCRSQELFNYFWLNFDENADARSKERNLCFRSIWYRFVIDQHRDGVET